MRNDRVVKRLNGIMLSIILCVICMSLSGCNANSGKNIVNENSIESAANSNPTENSERINNNHSAEDEEHINIENSAEDAERIDIENPAEDADDNSIRNIDEGDDHDWMVPQADHDNFTEQEKKQIEDGILTVVSNVWNLYEEVTFNDSLSSLHSEIVDFTKEKRKSVVEALGERGVMAAVDEVNTKNGELLDQFYDDYQGGIPGMTTVYKVYEDGSIGAITFLYRNEEMQTYYVGVKLGEDGEPNISGKSVQDIAAINYTEKGYFFYEYANPMQYASAFGYVRVSPLSDECRRLTERFLVNLDYQKYKLMVSSWNEDNAASLLMPGMFEDFYYIRFHEIYRGPNQAIPGELFEEILTTYLPVTVDDLRTAYVYYEEDGTYSQETVFNHQYPPFPEVTDYEYNDDGTITLHADAVWPEHNTDCAFSNVIVVRPFDDGTFRILSNEVEVLD